MSEEVAFVRGVDVVGLFVKKHPGILDAGLQHELVTYIDAAQKPAYKLGYQQAVKEVMELLQKKHKGGGV